VSTFKQFIRDWGAIEEATVPGSSKHKEELRAKYLNAFKGITHNDKRAPEKHDHRKTMRDAAAEFGKHFPGETLHVVNEELTHRLPMGTHSTEVYKNPNMREFRDHAYHDEFANHHTVKGLLHPDGTAHTFSGYDATHEDVAQHIKVHKDVLPVYIEHQHMNGKTIVRPSFWSAKRHWSRNEAAEAIKKHKWLNGTFKNIHVGEEH